MAIEKKSSRASVRLRVQDDLILTPYRGPETIEQKVEKAVKLIRSFAGGDTIEVAYSGGKDSDVILELVKMACVSYRAIYKCTTIDPPGTLKHVLSKGVEVRRPQLSFLEIVRKNSMPTRRARFCCKKLKEYKIMDKAVIGVRREESTARASRYSPYDLVICRVYRNNKRNHVNQLLPILNWSLQDIERFVSIYRVRLHPFYYDHTGALHLERRLGCLGCPMKSDRGVADFKAYPKLFRQAVRNFCLFWDNHPKAAVRTKFPSPWAVIAHNLFFDSYESWLKAEQSIFGSPNWRVLLEDYFGVSLDF